MPVHGAQTREAARELLSRFSHDVCSPLVTLRMLADTLAEQMPRLLAAEATQGREARIPEHQRRILAVAPTEIHALIRRMDDTVQLYRRRFSDLLADGDDDAAPAPGAVAPLSPPRPAGRARVLLVDDDLTNRDLTRVMLEWAGCHVTAAGGGDEALAVLRDQAFDLVLMDCRMPGTDGWTATRRLRERESGTTRRTPVIGLTASPDPNEREKGLAAGMDDFLVKPIDEEQLARLLAQFAARAEDHS